MLHTFQSKEERQTELQKLKATRELQLAESVKFLTALEPTPTRTGAGPRGEGQTGSPKADGSKPPSREEGYASLPATCGALKEPPVYEGSPAQPSNSVPPGHPATYEGSMGFMMNALTDTLKDLKEEMREIKGRVSDMKDPWVS
jgi:hypothetical protein